MRTRLRCESGSLHLPMAVILAAMLVAGLGFQGLLHYWRTLTATQLRLDHCVGSAGLELKRTIVSVERSNSEIKLLRASIAAAWVSAPQTIPALQASLEAVVIAQEAALKLWILKQATWTAKRGCGEWKDYAFPLPVLDWTRPPPDPLGQRALIWEGVMPSRFAVQAGHGIQGAAAAVEKQKGSWNAKWDVPGRWTSSY